MILDDQAEVVAFLSDPSHYPGAPAVERIDTHTASVFLAGDRAYKLKRAVRYDYLDFSTVERRAAACEAEVRLNRRTAPELYLGVIPLTRAADGTLQLGDGGPAVDWIVLMRRFAQEQLLDRVASDNRLSIDTVVQLADIVADFHERAEVRRDFGGAEAMSRVIEGNTRELEAAAGILNQFMVAHLTRTARDMLDAARSIVDGRRARGMVRQCHGDLHLRNVVLIDDVPTLFDAVEFNDDFSCIDVMYDLAFLLMDLVARHLPAHANALFNRYLVRTDDLEALHVLPLYLCCRAAIRAKTSLSAAALAADSGRRQELHRRAVQYLELAELLMRPHPARLLTIGGFSGTGKSTLARALAPSIGIAPGAVVVRSDEIRKHMFGREPWEALPEWAYAPSVHHTVYTEMRRHAAAALAAGYSVIVDAVFADATERRAIEDIAATAGVAFAGLWLEAPRSVLERRIRERRRDVSDASVDVLRGQLEKPIRNLRWQRVDAGGTPQSVERQARRVLAHASQGVDGVRV